VVTFRFFSNSSRVTSPPLLPETGVETAEAGAEATEMVEPTSIAEVEANDNEDLAEDEADWVGTKAAVGGALSERPVAVSEVEEEGVVAVVVGSEAVIGSAGSSFNCVVDRAGVDSGIELRLDTELSCREPLEDAELGRDPPKRCRGTARLPACCWGNCCGSCCTWSRGTGASAL